MAYYGMELIIDLKGCDANLFNRTDIEEYFKQICDLISMKRQRLFFWDYEGDEKEKAEAPDHLCGTSAVQFIKTSNITLHALDRLGEVYINIFSCKDFDTIKALSFTVEFFKAAKELHSTLDRGGL